jgi:hypothetical protein
MLINLSTLEVTDCVARVAQAWSPEFRAWVCLVESKGPVRPGVIEITKDDIAALYDMRLRGYSREKALSMLGVSVGDSASGV